MIIKMKKITLLCLADDRDKTVKKLGKLGILHIKHITPPESKDVDSLKMNIERTHNAIAVLKEYQTKTNAVNNTCSKPFSPNVVNETHELVARYKALKDELVNLNSEQTSIEPLGDFRIETISELADKGIFTKIYKAPAKTIIAHPDGTKLFILSTFESNNYFAIVGLERFTCDYEEVSLPSKTLSAIKTKIEGITSELASIATHLQSLSIFISELESSIHHLESEIEYQEARTGMGQKDRIAYIQGFCPEHSTELIKEASKEQGWGIIMNDPADDDRVPTLIKSPAWVRPIQSLFTILDILPGYKEVDIRPVFFIFFSLFFAMLVSDAGYGLFFLVSTFVFRAIFKKAPAGPFILASMLSVCAIIWGILTGSYFGIEHLPPVLSAAKIEWLKSGENIMLFSFLIGAVHLTIAHAWRAILTINSTRAIGQLGWICVTWSAYFLTRFLILGHALPHWFMIVAWTGIGLIALFMTPLKHLKTEWADHVMLPFNLVGSFADTVSYVRLFAVGSASLAVAEAFNELAIGNGVESIAAGIIAAVILILGHSLNIILALMSILVHGVRLNTLEFSGHIGLEWSGYKYKPFAEQISENKESQKINQQ